MKKEENFLWGLILLSVCGTASVISIIEIIKGTFEFTPLEVTKFVLIAYFAVIGIIDMYKSIKQ